MLSSSIRNWLFVHWICARASQTLDLGTMYSPLQWLHLKQTKDMEYFDWFVTMAKLSCTWRITVNSKRRNEWFIPIRVALVTHNVNCLLLSCYEGMAACFFRFWSTRIRTSKNNHIDEKKLKNIYSRAQKYFTYQASCEGEWEYGWLLAKQTMAGCFESFEKVFGFFGGKFKYFFSRAGPLEEARLFKSDKRACQRQCGLVDSSTCTWHVQAVF